MQEIVCGCSGNPEAENNHSCRCECPALIRLLRADDKSWFITEHHEKHNHSMSLTMGEKVHWPSQKRIYLYTKDLVKAEQCKSRENLQHHRKLFWVYGKFPFH
ncbi:hypothetical protein VPH35_077321 [Triticum aestivum]|uniref:FAR1 domain-containing protein n=1 Tax=Aegilops tauschii subsp. strangulata TaxID=200361 RepID=A0A453HNP0_AEGTS